MIPRSQLDQEIAVVPYMTLLLMLILTVLAVLVSIFIYLNYLLRTVRSYVGTLLS